MRKCRLPIGLEEGSRFGEAAVGIYWSCVLLLCKLNFFVRLFFRYLFCRVRKAQRKVLGAKNRNHYLSPSDWKQGSTHIRVSFPFFPSLFFLFTSSFSVALLCSFFLYLFCINILCFFLINFQFGNCSHFQNVHI